MNDAAYWHDRYLGVVKRTSQLLKRALDAERVVEAVRAQDALDDPEYRLCPELDQALNDYDKGEHR